ncbi:hypothetical protein ACFL4C_03730 [Candidatus Omnitrophota bacterium]
MIRKYFHQLTTGISFGMTSAVITSLGMIVGLHSATLSKLAVLSGIIIVAVADGLSDAAGMHISEESELEKGKIKHSHKEVWVATICTFLSVAGFSLTFAIPVLIFPLDLAILVAIAWGIFLLVALNLAIARIKKESALTLIIEHILLALFVIVISGYIGNWIPRLLK